VAVESDASDVDADPLAPDANPSDPDATPCPFANASICDTGEAGEGVDITSDQSFDTDTNPLCRNFAQADGPEACLVVVESFSVAEDVDVALVGSRPLLVASTGNIEILGRVDLSSRRDGQIGAGANFDDCAAMSAPEEDRGGAGGGSGGSFEGVGGEGGDGDLDTSLGQNGNGAGGLPGPTVSPPDFARGGCSGADGADEGSGSPGQGGTGGNSGGGVYWIAAGDFFLGPVASIRATGAGAIGGGAQSGGGGGGSGGLVRIDATTVLLEGNISANGGGGGEGGVRDGFGDVYQGNPGQNGTISAGGALGGAGSNSGGGDGGAGSLIGDVRGSDGIGANGGAGGGGGGAGYIVIKGMLTENGNASPPIVQVD
jgi:hypothetical protein